MTIRSKEVIEFEKTLRRCPFCRHPARLGYIRDGSVIQCTQCMASGPPAFNGTVDMPKAWIRARDAWNAYDTSTVSIPSDATIAAAANAVHGMPLPRLTAGDPDGGSD